MKVSIRKTKSMAMVYTLGLIRKNMQVGGVLVNSMASVFLFQKKVEKNLDYGKMERNYVGFLQKKPN
jgi:hypothetical protein